MAPRLKISKKGHKKKYPSFGETASSYTEEMRKIQPAIEMNLFREKQIAHQEISSTKTHVPHLLASLEMTENTTQMKHVFHFDCKYLS